MANRTAEVWQQVHDGRTLRTRQARKVGQGLHDARGDRNQRTDPSGARCRVLSRSRSTAAGNVPHAVCPVCSLRRVVVRSALDTSCERRF